MRKHTSCIVDNCTSIGTTINGVQYFTKGYCKKHYLRLLRYGDINAYKIVKGEQRTKNPAYSIYIKMKQRCNNPNDGGYKDYGGRGIKVCDRWLGMTGFANFINDMGDRPVGGEIDRIDNNGNYTPKNCKWSTRKEQMRNTRRAKIVTSKDGVSKPLADWADELGISQKTLWNRVLRGWSDEDVLLPMLGQGQRVR